MKHSLDRYVQLKTRAFIQTRPNEGLEAGTVVRYTGELGPDGRPIVATYGKGDIAGITLQTVVHIDRAIGWNDVWSGGLIDIVQQGYIVVKWKKKKKPILGQEIYADKNGELTLIKYGESIGKTVSVPDADGFIQMRVKI